MGMDLEYEHWHNFNVDDLLVREFDHWMIVVRQKQVTLGATVFLLKRPIESFAAATPSELGEIAEVVSFFESRTAGLWDAERFNYVAAMMKDPFVHIHAFPRYSGPRLAYSREWNDSDWPRIVNFGGAVEDSSLLRRIRDDLRQHVEPR